MFRLFVLFAVWLAVSLLPAILMARFIAVGMGTTDLEDQDTLAGSSQPGFLASSEPSLEASL